MFDSELGCCDFDAVVDVKGVFHEEKEAARDELGDGASESEGEASEAGPENFPVIGERSIEEGD